MARRKFSNEEQEREFWATHDAADEIDWSKATRVTLSKLKPSVRTISLRLPESILEDLKLLANKRDVPYQSLIKVFLSERLEREFDSGPGPQRAKEGRTAKTRQPTKPLRILGARG
jgi:predicted DNA binding CopG/RHH family protein